MLTMQFTTPDSLIAFEYLTSLHEFDGGEAGEHAWFALNGLPLEQLSLPLCLLDLTSGLRLSHFQPGTDRNSVDC